MSRVTVNEDMGLGENELWAANAERAIKGRKGQKFLREVEQALLALPEPRLIAGSFCLGGEVCLMGAAAVQRRIDAGMDRADALTEVEESFGGERDDDGACVGRRELGLTFVLAWELAYLNDGDEYHGSNWTPEERYTRCLAWVRERIIG